jgi:16S rRNA (cytosine1402-N4)-methyltransferase
MSEFNHYSVMNQISVEALISKKDGVYVDATFGGGGHSLEILNNLLPSGKLFAFDQDIDAINANLPKFKNHTNFQIINSNFKNLKNSLSKYGCHGIDGIVYDLGVSSYQLDTPERGFSYRFDDKLDMRMDQTKTLSAFTIVNEYDQKRIADILYMYGDEKHSRKIAQKIVEKRQEKPIETTFELVNIIKECYPAREMAKKHPAKKTFQALRIEVNNELGVFEESLEQALELLNVGGRIVVISFHSLEDKIVMRRMKVEQNLVKEYNANPTVNNIDPKYKLINPKVTKATKTELKENNRSHSALLRIIERKY